MQNSNFVFGKRKKEKKEKEKKKAWFVKNFYLQKSGFGNKAQSFIFKM